AIKRFELTFDLAWKLVKTFLEEVKGIRCSSPKDCFREAFHQGILDHNPFWLKIVDLRNFSVHIYSEKLADDLYKKLPKTLKMFKKLKNCL
ncbi:MAG: HI0074 family nucleotidyltransferase substrate-binding subunit, partial [Elusimicrobiales bacterium]